MKTFSRWILLCLATLAFIAPLKFGAPVVTQAELISPSNMFEWVFLPWPNQIATMFTFAVLVWLVLDSRRLTARVDALFWAPLAFLATQAFAATTSINPQVSVDTLLHFSTCVLLFYAAAWYVRDGADATWILGGMGLSTILVCVCALDQRFGFVGASLEDTRRYAMIYLNPAMLPQEYVAKMSSNRVFAWFGGYPNALAGYLVIAFSPFLGWIVSHARGWDSGVKWFSVVFAASLMAFCLVLTDSRGGFMAFGAMLVSALLFSRAPSFRRNLAIAAVLVLLLAAYAGARRQGFVRPGLSSLEARTDYWRGAIQIGRDHWWLGTGPGTFGSIYPKYKTAQTEEAQLVHNNFLQMWSDSGVLGFLVYAILWLLAIRDAFVLARQRRGDAAAVAIGAALVGWTVHGLLDFDLYIPGVALPAFLLLGALQGLKELPGMSTVAPKGKHTWILAGLCTVLVCVIIWIEGNSMAANLLHGQATKLAQDGIDPWLALQRSREAAILVPGEAHYQATAGALASRLGRHAEAIAYYQTAIANDPYRASYHWGLAQAEIAAHGVNAEAQRQMEEALKLNRTNDRYRQALSIGQEKR